MAPIKSSLAKSAKQLLGLFNTADLGLRGATQSTRRTAPSIQASGGTKTTSGNYTIHTFSYPTSDNFVVNSGEGECDILVIAGGGAGGSGDTSGWFGGGGGAGGYVYVTGYAVTPGTIPISIGQGGTGNPGNRGNNGGDSTFNAPAPNASKILAKGGGGGGDGQWPSTSPVAPGNPGGSGGGSGSHYDPPATPGGTALQPSQNPGFSNGTLTQYGFAGGTENGGNVGDGRGGGGGGAGSAGQDSPGGSPNGGGGSGRANSISGSSVTYAGGGETYRDDPHPAPGAAGSGGNGVESEQSGNSGQPGVIIVRYLS